MSRPLLYLRPAAQGFTVTLLVALAGCGLSSSPEVSKPVEPAPLAELHSAPIQNAVVKRMAMPAPMAVREMAMMNDRSEPREQYANLPDNPVHRVTETPVSTFSVAAGVDIHAEGGDG